MSLLAETSKEPAGKAETWFAESHPQDHGADPGSRCGAERQYGGRASGLPPEGRSSVCGRAGKAGKRSMNGSQYRKCGPQKGRKARKSSKILFPPMTSVNILPYFLCSIFLCIVLKQAYDLTSII